jgi:hypothetical protein
MSITNNEGITPPAPLETTIGQIATIAPNPPLVGPQFAFDHEVGEILRRSGTKFNPIARSRNPGSDEARLIVLVQEERARAADQGHLIPVDELNDALAISGGIPVPLPELIDPCFAYGRVDVNTVNVHGWLHFKAASFYALHANMPTNPPETARPYQDDDLIKEAWSLMPLDYGWNLDEVPEEHFSLVAKATGWTIEETRFWMSHPDMAERGIRRIPMRQWMPAVVALFSTEHVRRVLEERFVVIAFAAEFPDLCTHEEGVDPTPAVFIDFRNLSSLARRFITTPSRNMWWALACSGGDTTLDKEDVYSMALAWQLTEFEKPSETVADEVILDQGRSIFRLRIVNAFVLSQHNVQAHATPSGPDEQPRVHRAWGSTMFPDLTLEKIWANVHGNKASWGGMIQRQAQLRLAFLPHAHPDAVRASLEESRVIRMVYQTVAAPRYGTAGRKAEKVQLLLVYNALVHAFPDDKAWQDIFPRPGILLPPTTEEGGPPGLELVPNTMLTEEIGTGARVFDFTELPIRLLKEFRSSTGEFNLADMVDDYGEQEDMLDEANEELNKAYDYALDHGIIGCLPKKVKYTDNYEGGTKKARKSGSNSADEATPRTKRRKVSTSATEPAITDRTPAQFPIVLDEERSRRRQESSQEFLRSLRTTPIITEPDVFEPFEGGTSGSFVGRTAMSTSTSARASSSSSMGATRITSTPGVLQGSESILERAERMDRLTRLGATAGGPSILERATAMEHPVSVVGTAMHAHSLLNRSRRVENREVQDWFDNRFTNICYPEFWHRGPTHYPYVIVAMSTRSPPGNQATTTLEEFRDMELVAYKVEVDGRPGLVQAVLRLTFFAPLGGRVVNEWPEGPVTVVLPVLAENCVVIPRGRLLDALEERAAMNDGLTDLHKSRQASAAASSTSASRGSFADLDGLLGSGTYNRSTEAAPFPTYLRTSELGGGREGGFNSATVETRASSVVLDNDGTAFDYVKNGAQLRFIAESKVLRAFTDPAWLQRATGTTNAFELDTNNFFQNCLAEARATSGGGGLGLLGFNTQVRCTEYQVFHPDFRSTLRRVLLGQWQPIEEQSKKDNSITMSLFLSRSNPLARYGAELDRDSLIQACRNMAGAYTFLFGKEWKNFTEGICELLGSDDIQPQIPTLMLETQMYHHLMLVSREALLKSKPDTPRTPTGWRRKLEEQLCRLDYSSEACNLYIFMTKDRTSVRPLDPTLEKKVKEVDPSMDDGKRKGKGKKVVKKVVSPEQPPVVKPKLNLDKPIQGTLRRQSACVKNLREHYGVINSKSGNIVKCELAHCPFLHYDALVSKKVSKKSIIADVAKVCAVFPPSVTAAMREKINSDSALVTP